VRVAALLIGVAGCDARMASPPEAPLPAPALALATRVGMYVAPAGSPKGSGTPASPVDLATALAGAGGRLAPGDTVWLRGGTYAGCFTSTLAGSASRSIVVRQLPGERAILQNPGTCDRPTLTVNGAYTAYWGFEVRNAAPRAGGPLGIDVFGDNVRLINLVVHDAAGSGIGWWAAAEGGEVYGTLLYNNGRALNLDHALYTQNTGVGRKVIADNVLFDSWAYGLHAFGSAAASVRHYHIEGNIAFNNGSIGENGDAPNLFVGAGSAISKVVIRENVAYAGRASGGNVWVGYLGAANDDVALVANTVVGGDPALRVWRWARATVTANIFVGSAELVNLMGGTGGWLWSGNTHWREATALAWNAGGGAVTFAAWQQTTGLGAADRVRNGWPTGARVVVRPNKYERGRAHVAVLNWDRAPSVPVNLGSVLQVGDVYEIRNVRALWGLPLVRGTYAGGTVAVPMTAFRSASPTGGAARNVSPSSTEFQAFLVTRVPPP
jgi:hypothetical protein